MGGAGGSVGAVRGAGGSSVVRQYQSTVEL